MARIVLGLPGPWADDERESSDHYTTKIGGLPDWPPLSEDALRPELLICRSCGTKLSLVAQVYAPISTEFSNMEERTLYVFGCLMMNCVTSEQSWRIFRIQKAKDEKKPVASPPPLASKTNLWDLDFNGDEDDDDEDFDLGSLAKALSEAATVASNSKKQTKSNTKGKQSPLQSTTRLSLDKVKSTAVVPCFYIHSQEESPSKDIRSHSTNYSSVSIKDTETENDEEKWEDEKYEYDKALNADRTYLKFKKRIDANPEQCFRYSYGGKPLLPTEVAKAPEKCKLCGAPRFFEIQLMPPVIYFLQEAADDNLKQLFNNWDWMTLVVYTCSKSCSKTVEGNLVEDDDWIVAEEYIVVQYEKPLNLEHVSFFQ